MAKKILFPQVAKLLFPEIIFSGEKNKVYLTFDDGPHPVLTDWVFQTLEAHQMQATFFWQGVHAERYPDFIHKIKHSPHQLAHHGHEHLNGWKTSNQPYIDNCKKSSKSLHTNYFRPPYGKISPGQYRRLKSEQKVILWSILSEDFNQKSDPQDILQYLMKETKGGDIIVFHENNQSAKNLKEVLPRYLAFLQKSHLKPARIDSID